MWVIQGGREGSWERACPCCLILPDGGHVAGVVGVAPVRLDHRQRDLAALRKHHLPPLVLLRVESGFKKGKLSNATQTEQCNANWAIPRKRSNAKQTEQCHANWAMQRKLSNATQTKQCHANWAMQRKLSNATQPEQCHMLRTLQESSFYVYNQSFTNFSRVFLNFFPPVRNSATGQDFLSAAVAYIDVHLKLTQTSTQANPVKDHTSATFWCLQ